MNFKPMIKTTFICNPNYFISQIGFEFIEIFVSFSEFLARVAKNILELDFLRWFFNRFAEPFAPIVAVTHINCQCRTILAAGNVHYMARFVAFGLFLVEATGFISGFLNSQ